MNSDSSSPTDISTFATDTADDISASFPIRRKEIVSKHQLYLRFQSIQCVLSLTDNDFETLNHQRDLFLHSLSQEQIPEELLPRSAVTLVIRFIQFLSDRIVPLIVIRPLIHAFERKFLGSVDVHSLVSDLPDPLPARRNVLRTYYAAAASCFCSPKAVESALFKASECGSVSLYAVFGGQGAINPICVSELRDLFSLYQSLLTDLINATSPILENLSRLPQTRQFYQPQYLDIDLWLQDATSVPDYITLASAAFSCPVIGILSLAHFCVTCKILNKTPGELRSAIRGVTGHSQGLIIAAAIASSDSWASFYENARLAVEILFWIGYECHQAAPRCSLPAAAIADSLRNGEGQPASLLSVRGLGRAQIEAILAESNMSLVDAEKAYLALANTRENFVIAGSAKTLRGLSLHLRQLKIADDLDQSRIPFSRRKPSIHHQFLPVNTPFHSPFLSKAAKAVRAHLSGKTLRSSDMKIPVYHTCTGLDLRQTVEDDAIKVLINAVTVDFVDWPATLKFPTVSHIIAFDGSHVGDLIAKNKEGEGVRLILGNKNDTLAKEGGPQAELFAPRLPDFAMRTASWGDTFRPRLVRSNGGGMMLDTKLSRLLGTPPVMVAGMTPTTVHWDFVSAIMNAGYHVELAGGGYLNAESMSNAIRKIVASVPPGRGLTCNLIYVSPQAIAWQIPMLGQLIREGVPIDGLTIGAGVPSPDVIAGYITTLGLRHISFKPGSLSAIRQVISIAKVHTSFPIILQWTGGRGGGHHSFEDFHAPMLATYGEIRKCSNIVLVVGSGFGDAQDTYPYFTGSWAYQFGRCLMPFDGVLLGSRMMVAKEAHTSVQAKRQIVGAKGAADWEQSYDREIGGVITVQSEMGQPIHKIATRGVRFWAEMDEKIFKLPREQRLAELNKNREWIIQRLNDDFSKPWFGQDSTGKPVDVSEMTYAEVLTRLVDLMYITHQSRWINESYPRLVMDFVSRTAERLSTNLEIAGSLLENPRKFLKKFLGGCAQAYIQQLHPEDVFFFLIRCKARDQKPVNFVAALDDSFENWFKKDSLWQSEDVDAVINQDADRVCILHGPVAAQHSLKHDETAKSILDGISTTHVAMLRQDSYTSNDMPSNGEEWSTITGWSPHDIHPREIVQREPSWVANRQTNLKEKKAGACSRATDDWLHGVLNEDSALQGCTRVPNPFRRLFRLHRQTLVETEYEGSEIRLITGNNGQRQMLARVCCSEDFEISIDLYQPSHHGSKPIILPFKFKYEISRIPNSLSEVMDQRNNRIKSFYSKLWLGQDLDLCKRMDSIFHGEEITLTQEMLRDFVSTVGAAYASGELTKCGSDVFPIDCCILVAWDVLVRPLLVKDFDGDLLRLVHRSNTFEYVDGVTPLQVGDKVCATSCVQAIQIENVGKSVTVQAKLQREGQTVATVTSTFLCKGSFSDFASTFQHSDEPEMKLEITSLQDEAILRDRPWVLLDNSSQSLMGRCLVFPLRTQITWKDIRAISRLEITGPIYEKLLDGRIHKVGKVQFVAHDCQGNPVMDFLSRRGDYTTARTTVRNPGWSGESTLDVTIPKHNDSYARISRDYNPIHVSPIFAEWADLPGTITHGLFTSAITRGALEHLVGDEDRSRFQRFSTSFVGMVLPGDKLTMSFQHTAMVHGKMIFKILVHNKHTDEKVLEGEAEVEQETSAYVFTGQGSQEQGMGMALYSSSLVARKIWDEADKSLHEAYGWSILHIIRNNPKTLTVRFGGKRGRQIRENYLNMTTEVTRPDGRVVTEPLLKTLDDQSASYTFVDPRGLLSSTQFAQPAITLLEKATFEDMRSKGLVQENGTFAGHSLGEYGALSALADFIPFKTLMKVCFYRGLAMQAAMIRDEQGRTEYSMMAVSPTRIGKTFDEVALRKVSQIIMQESHGLLEIVNFNIEGEQYVCAGHLRNLATLTSLLDYLASLSSATAASVLASEDDLHSLIASHIALSAKLATPMDLERGVATIPLKGIDVPFHSTHLRDSVPSYRKFLQKHICKNDVQVEKLVDRFVPNLVAKPFRLDEEYLRETWLLTGSEVLGKMLEVGDA